MYSRKRKLVSPVYYQENHDDDDDDDDDDDGEEEDIWEREASVASSSIRKTPPNPYTKDIDILDNQHEILQKTENDLQLQLKNLRASLQALEQDELDEQAKLKQIEGEYLATVQEVIAFYEPQLKDTQDTDLDETITILNDTTYLKTDALLAAEIKRIIEDWKSVFTHENPENNNAIINTKAHQYRKTEFDVVDLIAQISGYEARIQSLNHDQAKLNSLPQIVPILRSEIERYASDMKETTSKLEQLEKDVIRPCLEKVSIQNVFYPLYASFIANELKLAQDYFENLEFLYSVCMKQRAYQQFVSLLYEKDAVLKLQKLQILKSLAVEEHSPHKSQEIVTHAGNGEEFFVLVIKDLLKNALNHIGSNAASLTLAEQIETLQKHAITLKQKWQEDFQSCQDAATELNLLHKRLLRSLYSHTRPSDELVITPKPYVALQEELEFRAMELTTALSVLQKEANNTDRKALFEQQRKLFSLFYTDPLTFEHLHSNC